MAYLDISKLTIVEEIKQELSQYKKEFLNIADMENQGFSTKFKSFTPAGLPVYSGNINTYMFLTDENLLDPYETKLFNTNKVSLLEKHKNRRESSPIHLDFLNRNSCVKQMFYNVMQPKSKINPHYGVNGIASNKIPNHFRIHITIEPGDDAYFCIENLNPLKYYENLCFGFEDGLVNHWAENRGTQVRTVLILDVDKSILPETLIIMDV